MHITVWGKSFHNASIPPVGKQHLWMYCRDTKWVFPKFWSYCCCFSSFVDLVFGGGGVGGSGCGFVFLEEEEREDGEKSST